MSFSPENDLRSKPVESNQKIITIKEIFLFISSLWFISLNTYIYIYRERETEREKERKRKRERERERRYCRLPLLASNQSIEDHIAIIDGFDFEQLLQGKSGLRIDVSVQVVRSFAPILLSRSLKSCIKFGLF